MGAGLALILALMILLNFSLSVEKMMQGLIQLFICAWCFWITYELS